MQHQIVIPIPDDTSPAALRRYLAKAVDERAELSDSLTGALRPALDLHIEDVRAYLYSVDIADVRIEEDGVQIDYDMHWSVHMGCKDMSHEGEDSRTVEGRTDGKNWIFEPHRRHERSTADDI